MMQAGGHWNSHQFTALSWMEALADYSLPANQSRVLIVVTLIVTSYQESRRYPGDVPTDHRQIVSLGRVERPAEQTGQFGSAQHG